MTATDIESRVIDIVVEQMCIDRNSVSRESTRQSLGMDSLDDVETIMLIEDEFDLSVMDEEAEAWKNVGDVIDYLVKRLAA
jgi:acyl carrier protein